MRTRYRLPILIAVLASLSAVTAGAQADDSMGESLPSDQQLDAPSKKQYDPRLPPVLPGEEITTESGKKMRVWSSSGPVPINQPTPPQYPGGGYGYGGWPPVIVDERGGGYGQNVAGAPGAPGVPAQPAVPGVPRVPGVPAVPGAPMGAIGRGR